MTRYMYCTYPCKPAPACPETAACLPPFAAFPRAPPSKFSSLAGFSIFRACYIKSTTRHQTLSCLLSCRFPRRAGASLGAQLADPFLLPEEQRTDRPRRAARRCQCNQLARRYIAFPSSRVRGIRAGIARDLTAPPPCR